jgi:hypothetical protein
MEKDKKLHWIHEKYSPLVGHFCAELNSKSLNKKEFRKSIILCRKFIVLFYIHEKKLTKKKASNKTYFLLTKKISVYYTIV